MRKDRNGRNLKGYEGGEKGLLEKKKKRENEEEKEVWVRL